MGFFSTRRAPTKRAVETAPVAGANGFGAPFHQVFSWHPLPEAGAMQYSYDTLCLPKYSPIGNGPGNAREFQTISSSMQPLHGVHLTAIGSPGVLTGQFVAQPLHDITSTSPQTVDNTYAGITLNPGQYQLPA
jgi:hypothetical protein